jgi:IMP dehydrogenase
MYKQYRGMGSPAAMKAGSAARYGHSRDTTRKVAAEGIEALKEVAASLDNVMTQLVGGLQSGMGYIGATNLEALRARARFSRITPAGQRESAPHDIVEVKTGTTNS